MIPRASTALADLAMKLATDILPETTSDFAMANTALISSLMLALAEDSERAIANRIEELDAMKQIFSDAAAHEASAPGTDDRLAFCTRQPLSLRLSDVNAIHADAMNLLIELHAWSAGQSMELNNIIWSFLHDHAERNKFESPQL